MQEQQDQKWKRSSHLGQRWVLAESARRRAFSTNTTPFMQSKSD